MQQLDDTHYYAILQTNSTVSTRAHLKLYSIRHNYPISTLATTMSSSSNNTLSSRWSLRGRNYIVTGGSKGIGKAVVRSLLHHGASGILFCSLSPCNLEDYCSSLGLKPNTSLYHVVCDISTEEGRKRLVEYARESFGSNGSDGKCLHGLVNNVGINVRKPILEQTPEEYHAMVRTNVDAAYFLSRLCSDLLVEGSTIVNVSSAAGVQSSGTGAVYGMTKAAINQFTRILACEWASRTIRVNAVTPWMTVRTTYTVWYRF